MVKVTKIGSNDSKILNEKHAATPNAFIAVTHPDCGHCKVMKPELNDLYDNLENYSGDVGIFDIHADAVPGSLSTIPQLESVKGFPTLIITKKGQTNPFIYDGDRSTDDMLNFCLQNMSLKKDIKTHSGGKKRTKKNKYSRKHAFAYSSVRGRKTRKRSMHRKRRSQRR